MLTLRDVGYRYPGYRRRAIEGISLDIGGGEIVGIVGPNEAGKSTLCLVAAGLAPGSIGGELHGDVTIADVSTSRESAHELAGRVGIVFANPESQRSGVTGTVFEEVALGPVNLGLPVAETVARTREALASLGIDHLAEREPGHLSGGQAQLVAIASMLALRPGLLVLDEPVAELDADGRHLVAEALGSLAAAGTCVLIAEHDVALLRSIGARIVALRDGRIETGGAT